MLPLLLVEGTVWPGMGPPGRGPLRPPPRLACSLQKFCANREVPVQTQNRGMERWRLSAEAGKASAPSPKGEGGHVRRPLPPAALHTRPCLGFRPSASRWMFTGTQPEYASLLFIPDCTCCPHLTFKRTLQTADTHTQKRQATLADARGALSPTGFGPG